MEQGVPKAQGIEDSVKPYYERDGIVIYHGDSRKVLAEMESGSVDMVFTDPPYGHNNNNGDLIHRWEAALGRPPSGDDPPQARPIANDSPEAAAELFDALLSEVPRLLRASGCCCCCGGGGPDPQFARWSLAMDKALTFKHMVIWDKGPMGMGWHYRRSYETVLVAHKGDKCRWYDETDRIENVIRPSSGISKIIPDATQHPTEKPWKLAAFFMGLHSQPGDMVLEPFCGSGSTLEAALRLGRKCIGIEIEEKYCEIAARRLENTTPSLFAEVAS